MKGDPLHLLISIPPKYTVSYVVGYIKGKCAIHIARQYMGKRRNFTTCCELLSAALSGVFFVVGNIDDTSWEKALIGPTATRGTR